MSESEYENLFSHLFVEPVESQVQADSRLWADREVFVGRHEQHGIGFSTLDGRMCVTCKTCDQTFVGPRSGAIIDPAWIHRPEWKEYARWLEWEHRNAKRA